MQLVIAVGLVALVAILFYRLVERRHKILVGKAALVLMALALAAIVYAWWSGRREEAERLAIERSVSITFVRDSASAASRRPYRSRHDTVQSVSFRVCNSGPDSVLSVEFSPHTLARGRSTENDIVIRPAYPPYPSDEFSSDYILPPATCSTLTWSGRYVLMDTVVAGGILARHSRQ